MPTTGRRVILNDGTTIENADAGYSAGILWVWFAGYTMQEAADLFLDPTNTEIIRFQYGEDEDTYRDFTVCTSISAGTDGTMSVSLKKGASE